MATAVLEHSAVADYLRHHLVGAATVISLVSDRVDDGQVWARLHAELEDERALVEQLLSRCGSGPAPLERVLGVLGRGAVRAKLLLDEQRAQSLGDLLEFELVRTGISGKMCMWRLLRTLDDPVLRDVDWDGLLDQAERQAADVERERVTAGREALTDLR